VTSDEHEVPTYEQFGVATRDLAQQVADDGFEPDIILAIARGGLGLAMGLGYAQDVTNLSAVNVEYYTGVDPRLAVIYEKSRSVVKPDYVWRKTDRWIDFPWSVLPPETRRGRGRES
jgi:hypoxanthine phosphoribosyltransferase